MDLLTCRWLIVIVDAALLVGVDSAVFEADLGSRGRDSRARLLAAGRRFAEQPAKRRALAERTANMVGLCVQRFEKKIRVGYVR